MARDGAKLYVRGDFAICRSCALRGAGVLVDPGAKRIWFSRMIQFVGSRAVPLPASQPILAQLLRTLKSHPGVVVRFEGHVNATCGLECRGATGKPCKAARKVGSDMCARCPGGAYGLSKARAEAIKSFVAVWKFTSLREASMAGRPKFDFHTGLLPSAAWTQIVCTPWASRERGA